MLISSAKQLELVSPGVQRIYDVYTRVRFGIRQSPLLKHCDSTLVLAYLDFLLAREGFAFYGNRFSSFSQELVTEFQDLGRPSQFYNPLSRSVSERGKA